MNALYKFSELDSIKQSIAIDRFIYDNISDNWERYEAYEQLESWNDEFYYNHKGQLELNIIRDIIPKDFAKMRMLASIEIQIDKIKEFLEENKHYTSKFKNLDKENKIIELEQLEALKNLL